MGQEIELERWGGHRWVKKGRVTGLSAGPGNASVGRGHGKGNVTLSKGTGPLKMGGVTGVVGRFCHVIRDIEL